MYFPLRGITRSTTKELDDVVGWINNIGDVQKEYQEIYNKNVEWACPRDDEIYQKSIGDLFLMEKEDAI